MIFVAASAHFEKVKNQNYLRDGDIERILTTLESRETLDKYSYLAPLSEIVENDYNLNIPRYVDTFEEEEIVDIEATKTNIAKIEKELVEVKAKMSGYLKELGL